MVGWRKALNTPHPLGALVFFSWALGVQLTGLAAFTKGFFLTRIELGRESECELRSLLGEDEIDRLSESAKKHRRRRREEGRDAAAGDESCWLPQRFERVVWVVIDALRYDFAAFSPPDSDHREGVPEPRHHSRGARHYLNHLPVIHEAIGGTGPNGSSSLEFEGSGGVLFQFEADPPTVTMQRLKGLTTGGLPTFIDFRDNFHSPEIAEDNWVAQIKARAARRGRLQGIGPDGGDKKGGKGGQLVFMGDDTWTSLYPTYFSPSYPFPSFNTRDLHTVDDGVLDHLSSELAGDDWEVLVAHFLGVDHVGHTFGPGSQAMEDKLDQMDAALRTVFSSVDEDTVVFVLGDHGMTEDGNHGGATAEETGAALLIWSRSAERLFGSGVGDGAGLSPPHAHLHHGHDEDGDERVTGDGEGNTGKRRGLGVFGGEGGEGVSGEGTGDADVGRTSTATPSSGRQVAQIDLVPTVALLMGVPVPFGNLGGIIPEVFGGPYELGEGEGGVSGGGGGDDDPRLYERLCDALFVNSVQVWRYLNEYASVASMPKDDMFRLRELLTDARDTHEDWRKRSHYGTPQDRASSAAELSRVCDLYHEFLDAAIKLGRELWTQYDIGLMRWGLAVLLAATLSLGARAVAVGSFGNREALRYPGIGDEDAMVMFYGLRAAGAGVAGAFLGDMVFGFGGVHVFASKVAICSAVGVFWGYTEALWSHRQPRRGPAEGKSGGSTPGAADEGGDESNNTTAAMEIATAVVTAATTVSRRRPTSAPRGDLDAIDGLLPEALVDAPESPPLSAPAPAPKLAPPLKESAGAGANAAATASLTALYCAGLFSNSFIEAEDGLHRFLGASTLLSLALALYLITDDDPRRRRPRSSTSKGKAETAKATAKACSVNVALAAACVRASAAVQESIAGVGVSTEATFGVARSLLPLTALWCVCARARGCVFGCGLAFGFGSRWDKGRKPAAAAVLGQSLFEFHGAVQALSLAATGAYWISEAAVAARAEEDTETPANPENVQGTAFAGLKGLPPSRLLFPRVIYLLCAVGFATALLLPEGRARRSRSRGRGKGRAAAVASDDAFGVFEGTSNASGRVPVEDPALSLPYAQAAARTAAGLVSHLLPIVVLLLGPGSPAIVLLVAAACGFALRGVSIAVGSGAAVPLGAVALAWSVVGRAFFFLTGHHNQFNRLQYSAAFVGFDEFNFKIGGVLLFLNTFGTEILAALALPMLAAAVANKNSPSSDRDESEKTCHQQQEQEQGEQGFLLDEEFFEGVTTEHGVRRRRRNVVGGAGAGTQVEQPEAYREAFGETSHPRGEATSGSTSPLSGRHHSGDGGRRGDEAHETALHPASSSSSAEAFLSAMERISGLVLALSSARTFLSAANISVQRGHLMLWAVFAPKFVFDATMQAVCGAAAVATWAVVLVVHRAFYS